MFNSLNKVSLIGKTSFKFPPEFKVTPSGTPILRFSMATTEVTKDKEGNKKKNTEYHRIVIWGKLAELGERFIKMDSLVYIEGKLRTNQYTDQSGKEVKNTEIVAHDFVILDSTPYAERQGGGAPSEYRSSSPARDFEPGPAAQSGGYDDDIPF
ncbi:single-stranded DNA-binding protein [Holophaga foetida]|uniref:single-stranded DNA-binding protein n=1 Tax=Holophaga foetida TaxID=35839 RepID=UPI0002473F60|nr:single-stranded DNA-binding protein [Holophaga foetida]